MAIMETLPATGRIYSHVTKKGEYLLYGYQDQDKELNEGRLGRIARGIDMKSFYMEREDAANDVAQNLRSGGSIIIVTNPDGDAIGYSSQRVLEPRIDGNPTRIMFTTTRAFEREHQALGLAPATMRLAFNMHSAPDLVAGLTGMGPVVDAYVSSGIIDGSNAGQQERVAEFTDEDIENLFKRVKLFPFHMNYGDSESMAAARDYVMSRSKYKNAEINPSTGVIQNLYDKDGSKLFDPLIAGSRSVAIARVMKEQYGCDLSHGSAMLVIGVKKGWSRFLV